MSAPLDYFDRPVQVGDVLTSVCWDSRGFPLWATNTPLTVVKVNRTRVVVTGSFNGSYPVLASCACIIERDGKPFATDRDAWHANKFSTTTEETT